ncbi:MAG: hypothetical protein JW734_07010 [Candidatus Omnitrophica bacterium]|nr:hypothetical protein [Candidatus Omnitrophota bacterium]
MSLFLLYLTLIVYAILGFYFIITGNANFGVVGRILSLSYPLLWNITHKSLRRFAVFLVGLTFLLSKSWICIVCGSITLLIIYRQRLLGYSKAHRLIVVILVSALIASSFLYVSVDKKPLVNLQEELAFRIEFIKMGIENWDNKLWGDGPNSFARRRAFWRGSVPDSLTLQSTTYISQKDDLRKYYIYDIHCDLLQWCMEFGVIFGAVLIFLLFLPLAFLGAQTLYEKTILASYICLLIQCLVDFPLHRSTTSLLSMIIITLAYRQVWHRLKRSK